MKPNNGTTHRRKRPTKRTLHLWSALVSVVFFAIGCAPEPPPPETSYASQNGWVLSPTQAKAKIASGALVLDARIESAYKRGHVPGAQRLTWRELANQTSPFLGRILDDAATLTSKLQAAGISSKRPIVVIGDTKIDFGATGRLVWTLRTLGHPDVAFVDGGIASLAAAGQAMTTESSPPSKGDFVVSRKADWEIRREALVPVVARQQRQFTLIDARTEEEYNGATPYGETRGGHLPGAVSFHYKEVLNQHGQLKSRNEILALLKAKGITLDKPVIAYCTAGVRAGFLSTILIDLGFQYTNHYAGSMLEWSSMPPATHPLEK